MHTYVWSHFFCSTVWKMLRVCNCHEFPQHKDVQHVCYLLPLGQQHRGCIWLG